MKNLTPVQSLNRTVLQLLLFALLCCGTSHLSAQCNNDITPPVPVCANPLQKQVQLYATTIIQAAEFDAGSTDNCTAAAALQFFVELGSTPSPAPPPISTLQYPQGQVGQFPAILWVVDSAGNAANCATTLDLVPCTNSTPAITCRDQLTVQLGVNGTALVTPGMMLVGGPYCPDYDYLMNFPPAGQYAPTITVGTADIGTRLLQVTAFQNGNKFNSCWGTLTVTGGCNPDVTPATAICAFSTDVAIDTSLSEQFVLWPDMLDQGSYDNCTAVGDLNFLLGLTGPAGQFLDSLVFDTLGTYNVALYVADEAGNQNYCWTEVTVYHKPAHLIRGTVFRDENADCDQQPGSEPGLAGWPVRAVAQSTGAVYLGSTDATGHYSIKVPEPLTAFDVAVAVPFNYGGGVCPTTYVATFTQPNQSEAFEQDLPVILNYECSMLYVDLATPRIRPCFPGIYYVQYVNLSGNTVPGTYVDVTLDAALEFVGSSIPETDLGNQVYRFQTGDLAPGAGGRFSINFFTACNTPAGATHCTEAHIFPDTLCENNPSWSGADVTVQAVCDNDSVRLSIKNIGTGPNAGPLGYIVVEDVLMRGSNTFQLNAGQTMLLDPIPATGATIRLQAQQEPGHPYGGVQAVALEGCGGFTPGMVTIFPLSPADPFVALHCRQNVASYDPNDKQALPLGYGAQHFVEKNTDLDYTIRFQNTGTDTAYTVVLLDTLSQFLAARQIRPGVSSHPFRFELLDGRIAKFVFENILLPDSNANLAASEGFVQFRVPQTTDNPDGTRIENTAAIYFDFNDPVITNTVWHTVGTNFVTTSTTYADPNRSPLRVYPNPASTVVHFAAAALPGEVLNLSVTDALGREVRSSTAEQMPISLDCSGLPAGTYFFHIRAADARTLWAGTLLVR